MKVYDRRMDEVKRDAFCVPLRSDIPYVLMSDCHRGDGNWNDNFASNKTIYLGALCEYYSQGYTYLELGDGDELWENKSMEEIMEKHGEVFSLLKKYYNKSRLYMIYGNHDMEKCHGLNLPCFPDLPIHESILLKGEDGRDILLIHGHQGDLINECLWKLSRFLVRYLWRPLEQLGIKDPTSAAKNYRKKDRVEKRMSDWAKTRRQLLVAGHTHRPHLPAQGKEDWYFNTGSGVHPHSVTAIEIRGGKITLVKWIELADCNQFVKVKKEVLSGPIALSELPR